MGVAAVQGIGQSTPTTKLVTKIRGVSTWGVEKTGPGTWVMGVRGMSRIGAKKEGATTREKGLGGSKPTASQEKEGEVVNEKLEGLSTTTWLQVGATKYLKGRTERAEVRPS